MLERVWRKGDPSTLLAECKLMGPLWRTLWIFLKKLKIEPLYYASIPILDIYLGKTKTLIQKDTHTVMFIEALLTIVKTWKQSKCLLTEDWLNKMCCVCIHLCILYMYIYTLFGHKRK